MTTTQIDQLTNAGYLVSLTGFPGTGGERLWYVRHREAPQGCTLGHEAKYFIRADGSWKRWSDGVWTGADQAPWSTARDQVPYSIPVGTPSSLEGRPLVFIGRCLAAGLQWSPENESHTPVVNGRDLCYRVLTWQGRRYLAFEWTQRLLDDRSDKRTLEEVISGEITAVHAETAEECPFDGGQERSPPADDRTRGLAAVPAPAAVMPFVSMKAQPVALRGATKQKGLF